MGEFSDFLAVLSKLIVERGLQQTFGLKLLCDDGDGDGQTRWTEFELHSKRGTIMFPEGIPMPKSEGDLTVTTEWDGTDKEAMNPCKHAPACRHTRVVCKHCKGHNNRIDPVIEDHYCVGGQQIPPGTTIHNIVHHIVAAF